MFLVSCNKEGYPNIIKGEKSFVESYEMTTAEKNTLNKIGEKSEQLGIFKVKLNDSTNIHSLEAKIKVYASGKLIHTIGGIETILLKEDKKSFYLTYKRQLQLGTKQTYEWGMIFAATNGHTMGQSVYKQPEQTNMSSYGTV